MREKPVPFSRRTIIMIGAGGGASILSTTLFPVIARAQAPTITQIAIDIWTHGDDKDRGRGVKFSFIKDNNVLWSSNHGNTIGDDLVFRNNSTNTWAENTPPIVLDDRSKFQFSAEQDPNDTGWEVSFGVKANNGSIILIRETPRVTFGNRTIILPNLTEPEKTRVQHTNGSPVVYFKIDP